MISKFLLQMIILLLSLNCINCFIDFKYIKNIYNYKLFNTNKDINDIYKSNDSTFFSNVNTLVISGGGIFGLSYVSLLNKINIQNNNIITNNITSYSGSSIGALISTLLNFGFELSEIEIMLSNIFFNNILNENIFKKIYNIFTKYGQNDGILIYNYFNDYISTHKKEYINITFGELHNKTNKNLFIIATNLDKEMYEVFSHYTTPLMKVNDAILLSTSAIPFLTAQKYNNSIYIDAGYTIISPYKIFVEQEDIFTNIFYEKKENLIIDEEQKINNLLNKFLLNKNSIKKIEKKINELLIIDSFSDYNVKKNPVTNIINLIKKIIRLNLNNNFYGEKQIIDRILIINTYNISAFDFNNKNLIDKLLNFGINTYDNYFY